MEDLILNLCAYCSAYHFSEEDFCSPGCKERIKAERKHWSAQLTESQQGEGFHLGYILGVMYTDGYVGQKYAAMSSTDRDFVEQLQEAFFQWLGFRPRIRAKKRGARRNWIVGVARKAPREFLRNYPIGLVQDREMRRGFLKGFFDSDGSIKAHRIEMYNTDRQLIGLVARWLQDRGIPSSTHVEQRAAPRWKPLYRLCIFRIHHRLAFVRLIGGITIRRKVRPEYEPALQQAA